CGERRVVERGDRTRTDNRQIGERPVLVHVERDHDMTARGDVGNIPVTLHLRDEPANPGPELYTLGVELNFWTELSAAAFRVVIRLDIALKISERVAQRAACRCSPSIAAVCLVGRRRGQLQR